MSTPGHPNQPIHDGSHRLAVETDDRSIVVSAGAGSGKTQVLAERFVHLVTTNRAPVDGILTITYTRKAAREMRERIVRLLEQQGIADATWRVENAYISTIDSLCARLIRENPLESATDPFFEQLSEHDAERQFYHAFDRVVDRHSPQPDSAIGKLLREAFGRMRFGGDPHDALHTLRKDLFSAMETIRLFGWSRAKLLEWAQELEQDPQQVVWQMLKLMRSALLPAVKAARGVLREEEELAGELRRVETLLQTLEKAGDVVEVASRLRQGLIIRGGNSHIQHPVLAECVNRLREWVGLLNTSLLQQEVDESWRTVTTLRLLVEAWDEYQRVKAQANQCDFADVMSEAIRLLREHENVRRRYRQRFRFVMVDEFQDANHLQMQLIQLLSNTRNLFVVGDAQQSIYAFRHADVSLFRQLERKAHRSPENALLVSIGRNFRSRPEILRFVACLFGAVWSPSVGGDRFKPLHSARRFASKQTPSVEFVLTPPAQRNELWLWLSEATARHIRQTVEGGHVHLTAEGPEQGQPVRYRHIAILLRQTSDVPILEEALSRNGVPFYNTARRQYFIQPEVRDLVFALTTVDSPTDDIAVACVLRSPMVGVSMDTLSACARQAQALGKNTPLWLGVKEWLTGGTSSEDADAVREFVELVESLQREIASLDVAQMLGRLVTRTHYETRLLCRPEGKQKVANVRKLLQIAAENRHLTVAQFVEMVNELERIALREGEAPVLEEMADVVRIYTIHGAKGLQFPVVYLADVARSVRRKPQSRLVTCVPSQRFVAQGFVKQSVLPQAGGVYTEQRDREEGLRVWYVAMTRAIEHLVFVAPNSAGGLWWNLFLDALQLPHHFSEDTVLRIAEGCEAQVRVVDSQSLPVHRPDDDEAYLHELAQWLGGTAPSSVEEILRWLATDGEEIASSFCSSQRHEG